MRTDNLYIPPRIRFGISPLKSTIKSDVYCIGTDTETKHGKPITFQFFCPELNINSLIFLKNKKPSDVFIDFLDKLPKNNSDFLLFGHNLKFDGLSFFYDMPENLRDQRFKFTVKDWTITGVYANLVFFRFFRDKHSKIAMYDTFAFYKGSLKYLAEKHCPHLPKLKYPPGLGKKNFTEKDRVFCRYAMRDAEIAYYVGKNIIELHRKLDIPMSVSIADLASKNFRKNFIREKIPYPGGRICRAGYSAYHGGKNLIRCSPGVYENVTALDIISAYPHAMTELPDFYDKTAYYYIPTTKNPAIPPPWGVYKVSGEVYPCPYPIVYDIDFKPVKGKIENIWVSGWELIEAINSNEFDFQVLEEGFCYCPEKTDYLPLKNFVDHYFKLKDKEKDPILRLSYKLILNSLSGKFVQTVKENVTGNEEYNEKGECLNKPRKIAGGLFHPFIASLITGHTRAKIHRLEHKYKSIHTSTDGIFTQEKISKKDLTAGLGGVKIEAKGKLLILRNKLYLFMRDDGDVEFTRYKKEDIIKYALHGFRGNFRNLIKLWKSGKNEYHYMRCNTLKDSLKRGKTPNKFDLYKEKIKY